MLGDSTTSTDLILSATFNSVVSSSTLGDKFAVPPGYMAIKNSFLAGASSFLLNEFEVYAMSLYSEIINVEQQQVVVSWINASQPWFMCYNSRKDGTTSNKFHDRVC